MVYHGDAPDVREEVSTAMVETLTRIDCILVGTWFQACSEVTAFRGLDDHDFIDNFTTFLLVLVVFRVAFLIDFLDSPIVEHLR